MYKLKSGGDSGPPCQTPEVVGTFRPSISMIVLAFD